MIEYAERAVLLFGRESVGLPRELRDRYRDRRVRFPIHDDGVRSLNLANSVALAAYEVLRHRHLLLTQESFDALRARLAAPARESSDD